jgi:hypothetical protein
MLDFVRHDTGSAVSALWNVAEREGLLDKCISDQIIAAFDVGYNVQFHPEERFFRQRLVFVVIDYIGCAFFDDYPMGDIAKLVGTRRGDWPSLPLPGQVAILDSLFHGQRAPETYNEEHILTGLPSSKGVARTRLICDEVERLCHRIRPGGSRARVGLVGVSRLQASSLRERGFEVHAWDLDANYIGRNILPGVLVSRPRELEVEVAMVDVLLISGMTIANGSLFPLLQEAQKQRKGTIVWAVTGCNIAPQFHQWGLDVAICEHFPQHFLPGQTRIEVTRSSAKNTWGCLVEN